MKYHYVYRITNILLNKHYYGVRTSKNKLPSEDLGIFYFSSSLDKKFIADQKENPKNYKYKVIKIFPTREKASLMEILLHERFDVKNNKSFYNKSKASSIGFSMEGEDNPMFGKKHSSETISKMKLNHKGMLGKTFSKETKELMKISNGGSNNGNSKTIFIYSSDKTLMYTCNGNFKNICDQNNLPYSQLMKSYKNNNQPILENLDKSAKTRMIKLDRLQFKGWFASYNKI